MNLWLWQFLASMTLSFSLTLFIMSAITIYQSKIFQTKRNFILTLFFSNLSIYFFTNHVYLFYFSSFNEKGLFYMIILPILSMVFLTLTIIWLMLFVALNLRYISIILFLATISLIIIVIFSLTISVIAFLLVNLSSANGAIQFISDILITFILSIAIIFNVTIIVSCFYKPLQHIIFYQKEETEEYLLIYRNYRLFGLGFSGLSLGSILGYWEGDMSLLSEETFNLGVLGATLSCIAILTLMLMVFRTRSMIKEEAFILLEKQLEDQKGISEMKDQFISVTSHEIRTPFHIVKGNFELLLQRNDLLPEDKEKIIGGIIRNMNRMEIMINNIYSLSMAKQKQIYLNFDYYNLYDVIKTTIEDMKLLVTKKGLTLNFTPNPVNNQDQDNLILCDAKAIEQVIRNLIHNSIKFTEKGRIDVLLKKQENMYYIIVKDTGVGIDTQDFDNLFADFRPLDSNTNKPHQGLGLGLFLSKKIIKEHKGKIWIFSEGINKGTEVHFTLPRSR
ncbi:MAG: ATP-binding protein [Promethearchaeota archaeon]